MACIEVEKVNESVSRICMSQRKDEDVLEDLKDFFTVEVEGARWTPAFKQRHWDGKISFFNPSKGMIYNGLLERTKSWCLDRGIEFKESNFPEYPLLEK